MSQQFKYLNLSYAQVSKLPLVIITSGIDFFKFLHSGDLKSFLLRRHILIENDLKLMHFSEHITNICIIQILHGLKHLHDDLGIIHRDLKPENILHDQYFNWKIGDLGTARTFDTSMTPDIGTLLYAAPEMLHGNYTNKIDIFSMGLIIFEIYQRFQNIPERNEKFRRLRHDRKSIRMVRPIICLYILAIRKCSDFS